MTILNMLGHFLLGLRDSLSLVWIKQLLYCQSEQGKLHSSAIELRKTLSEALIRIGLTIFIVPLILNFLGIHFIAFLFRLLFLILSYGYIAFYNQKIITTTKQLILFRKQRLHETHFELDISQQFQTFSYLSGVVKGIIFFCFYYLPIMTITTILAEIIPYFGMFTCIVSEAFFNPAFIFLTAWPYDRYNAAFLQKEKYYLLGFGIIASIICNYCLSGFASLGVGLIISLWMLINSVIYGPVQKQNRGQFNSIGEIVSILTDSNVRNQLKNSYNLHRQRLRNIKNDPKYINYGQNLLLNTAFLVNPAFKITEYFNIWIENFLRKLRGNKTKISSQIKK